MRYLYLRLKELKLLLLNYNDLKVDIASGN